MIARLAALTVALLAFAAVPVVAQPAFPEGIADTSFAEADGDRVIRLSVLVAAPSDQVWTALTTEGGWRQRMGVGFAKIDFRIGGMIETSYGADATEGSPANIRNEIVTYVPGRLLAIRNVQAPPGFRYAEEFSRTATLLELEPEGGRTRVTLTAMAFPRTEAFDDLYARFHFGDAYTLAMLRDSFGAE